MPFATEVDEFLAQLQARVDAAMGEARTELREMAAEAEDEWASWRKRLAEFLCEPPRAAAEAASQPETSASEPESPPPS